MEQEETLHSIQLEPDKYGTGGHHYIVYNKNQTNMEQEDDIT